MSNQEKHIAVIGAGMAGLACATKLAASGAKVTIFDKGRGPGGRMAARRAEIAGNLASFDHGAQSFSAKNPAFAQAVADWHNQGVIAPWPARGDGEWVGVPGMNGPLRAMAQTLDVHWGTRVHSVERSGEGWLVISDDRQTFVSDVAVAIPAEQASVLLGNCAPSFASIADSITSGPCWAVMAGFATRLPVDRDWLQFDEASASIASAARNSAKPHRSGTETWLLHASAGHSAANLEQDPNDIAPDLLAAFFQQAGIDPVAPLHLVAHRWRYALPLIDQTGAGDGAARWDAEHRIGIAGDYLAAPNVEGAWLSGQALADQILG